MGHRQCIEALDRTMNHIMQNMLLFGEKVILFSAVYQNVFPVVPSGLKAHITNAYVKSSFVYDNFLILRPTENMRIRTIQQDLAASGEGIRFPQFFLKVG